MKVTAEHKQKMLAILEDHYRATTTALEYSSSFELLVAVILSAQCTDERVNIITKRLFPRYNTPERMLSLGEEKLAELIRDCGLFRSKAKNLIATCKILCQEHQGQVPNTFEELIKLPGVGRKTANVLLSQLFNVPAIAVDTHVFRVSNRLGIAKAKTPEETERQLNAYFPKEAWSKVHHLLIFHGRYICHSQKPECGVCLLREMCKHYNEINF